jgi:DNA-binding GntR family transcriptional regulator
MKPSYREIADTMAERIKSGVLKPGDQMPTYEELAEEFGVSRATAARAYGLLADRGLTLGQPGRAVFVAKVTKT